MNRNEIGAPSWKSIMVTRHLPEKLLGLETLCKNLWWCWNDNAKALFKSVDARLWHKSGHNPMEILDKVSIKRYQELAEDEEFVGRLDNVMREFDSYMEQKSKRTEPSVAYFCMEYGLDTSLRIYSGGLGILAGDYLKAGGESGFEALFAGCDAYESSANTMDYINESRCGYFWCDEERMVEGLNGSSAALVSEGVIRMVAIYSSGIWRGTTRLDNVFRPVLYSVRCVKDAR